MLEILATGAILSFLLTAIHKFMLAWICHTPTLVNSKLTDS